MKNKFYNQFATETYEQAKMINGNPSGIINLAKSPFKWCRGLWDVMHSYTWFTSECNLAQDRPYYLKLDKDGKYTYDLALAQLITNDSLQTKQLSEGVNGLITAPEVCSLITRQAYEEANHSNTYTTAAEEVTDDDNVVYNLHKVDKMLISKNQMVADMFENINTDKETITDQEKLVTFAANQILEQLVFPGGFLMLWSFNFPGTNKMISFIERDETGTHVPLFMNIFNTTVRQVGITEETVTSIQHLIKAMVDIEIKWTKYLAKNKLGFSDQAIELYVQYHGNSVCKNLNLPLVYDETDGGPLMSIVHSKSMLSGNNVKANFFETAVSDYDVAGLDGSEDY